LRKYIIIMVFIIHTMMATNGCLNGMGRFVNYLRKTVEPTVTSGLGLSARSDAREVRYTTYPLTVMKQHKGG